MTDKNEEKPAAVATKPKPQSSPAVKSLRKKLRARLQKRVPKL